MPYDGADPAYADLYHDLPKDYPYGTAGLMSRQAPDSWKLHCFKRIKDLVDNYQPDLLYTDGDIFFEEYGLALVANLYNLDAETPRRASCEAVYTSKLAERLRDGHLRARLERGVVDGIPAQPLANRHVHRRVALQQGGEVQDRPSTSSTCWWTSSAATATCC